MSKITEQTINDFVYQYIKYNLIGDDDTVLECFCEEFDTDDFVEIAEMINIDKENITDQVQEIYENYVKDFLQRKKLIIALKLGVKV